MNEKKVQQQQQNNFNIYAKEMPLFHIPLLILLAFLTFERVHAQVLVETCLAEGKSDFKVTSSKSCPCNMRALVRANASTSGIAVTVAALPVDTYQKWRNLNAQRHDTIVPLPKDHNIINVAQLPFSTFTNRTWKLDTAPLLSSLEYKFVTIFRRAPISSSSRATGKGNGNGNGNGNKKKQCVESAISLETQPKVCPLRIPTGSATYSTSNNLISGAPVARETDFSGYNVLITGANRAKCGGSVIARDWILTAASCNISRADNVSVVGKSNSNNNNNNTYAIKRVIAHERFADLSKIWDGGKGFHNDIALLHLATAIEGAHILRLNSNETAPAPGTLVRATAFEENPSVLSGSMGLRMVDVAIDSDDDCRERLIAQGSKNIADTLDKRKICTKHDPVCTNGAICDSDVGSPLVALLPYGRNKGAILQIGLVTYSGSDCIPTDIPDLFTRTSAYIPWIEKTTGIAVEKNAVGAAAGRPKTAMIIVVAVASLLFISTLTLIIFTVLRRKRRKEKQIILEKAQDEDRLRELMASWEQFNQERALRESTASALPMRDYDYRLSTVSGRPPSDERRLTF